MSEYFSTQNARAGAGCGVWRFQPRQAAVMRTCKLIASSPARVYIALPKRLSQKKRWFGASTSRKPSWDTKIECPALINTNDHASHFPNRQNSLQKVTKSSPSTKLVLSAPGLHVAALQKVTFPAVQHTSRDLKVQMIPQNFSKIGSSHASMPHFSLFGTIIHGSLAQLSSYAKSKSIIRVAMCAPGPVVPSLGPCI